MPKSISYLSAYHTLSPEKEDFARNVAWGRQEFKLVAVLQSQLEHVGIKQWVWVSDCCALVRKRLFPVLLCNAKPRLFSTWVISLQSNKGVVNPALLAVQPLSARTSGMGLCSRVLQYSRATDRISAVLVCAVCCCDTSQMKH